MRLSCMHACMSMCPVPAYVQTCMLRYKYTHTPIILYKHLNLRLMHNHNGPVLTMLDWSISFLHQG